MSQKTAFLDTGSGLDVWVFCRDTLGLFGSRAKEPEVQF